MTIVADLHGVFIDCLSIGELGGEVAKKLFGANIPPQDFGRSKVIGNNWLSEAQYLAVSKEVYGNWQYASRMRPINGYQIFNEFAKKGNIRLIILTSVTGQMIVCAKRWLKERQINFEKILGIGVNKNRAPFLTEFQADIYIDDSIENLEKIQKTLKLPCRKFLMVAGGLKQTENTVGITSVSDLEDFTRAIQEFKS